MTGRLVRGILNKLTPEKFQKLSDDLLHTDLDSSVILKGVILLIFEKALDEPKYSSMYAQLCKRLSEEAPNFEPPNCPCTFKLLLLNKCRDEFENRAKASEAFEHRDGPLAPEEEERRQLAKRKMLGNIKFIGELGKLEILRDSILHKCCQTLLGNKRRRGGTRDMAEDLECLCQIMKTCGRVLDTEKGKSLMNQYFDRMAQLAENHDLPLRIRFMLRDTIELRKNKWVPRKAANTEGPMPIREIRDEDTRDRGYMNMPNIQGSRVSGMSSGGAQEFFRNPLKMRSGLDDVLGPFPVGGSTLGIGPGVIPTTQDKFGFGTNGYQSGFRQRQQQFGQQNFFHNRQNFNHNQNKQQQQNQQNQQQNYNNLGSKELPPRFKNKMVLTHPQGQGNIEEVSLRPAANSMMIKPKTQATLPKTTLGPTPSRQTGLLADPLLQPPQTTLLSQKPAKPLLHKEAPILIKQASLDKNRGGKKDKGPSKEEVMKKIDNLLEDFMKNKNLPETLSAYREQKMPERFVPEVLVLIMNKTLDRSESDREMAANLMSGLKKESLLTSAQFLEGFKELLGQMQEKEQDIPRIKSFISVFAANAIAEELSTVAEMAEPMENGTHYPLFLLTLQQLHKAQGKTKLLKLFNESKVNLLSMLPEMDRTKEQLALILEDRGLNFLFPLLRIQAELWKQLQADPNPTPFYKWIKDNLDPSHYTAPGFINALMTVIVKYITQETTLSEGVDPNNPSDKALQEKEKMLLEKFKPVLQAFLHDYIDLQVIAVYALQVYLYSLQFPKGMLLRWFVNLYDLEVVEEEAFLKWKEDVTDDYPGKGKALFQVNHWLVWLAEAESEEEDEGDN